MRYPQQNIVRDMLAATDKRIEALMALGLSRHAATVAAQHDCENHSEVMAMLIQTRDPKKLRGCGQMTAGELCEWAGYEYREVRQCQSCGAIESECN